MTKILLTMFVVFVTGCSLFQRKNQSATPAPAVAPASQKVESTSVEKKSSAVEQSLSLESEKTPHKDFLTNDESKNAGKASNKTEPKAEMSVQLKKIDALADKNTPEKDKSKKMEGIDPQTALTWLKHGNTRFVKGYVRKDGQSKKDILRVSEKQKPNAIVFASSDSRMPPEIVFDQKLGELFVIRNVGGSLDPSVVSSIEYAVDRLGVRLLVLLGPASTPTQKSRVLANLVKIQDALPESSELLKEKLASGEFQAKIAVYDLKTGQVDFQ